MNSPDQFVGGQFAWFTGVVEDVLDPLQQGRVKVRCFGYHNEDRGEIPTAALPWAYVTLPVTSSSMSGVGRSATGLQNGSWVVGFFRDGPSAQEPLIIGSIPSISIGRPAEVGFSDPRGVNPVLPGTVDTPIEARGDYRLGSTFVRKTDLRQENVETAVPPRVTTVAADKADSYYARKTWSNWKTEETILPSYPNNHVWHTSSGHVLEFDDTDSARRISEMHASGTYREINNEGDQTLTVVGNRYTVVFKDDNVYIKGACNLTIDGDLRTLVKGNYHLEVEKDFTQNIKGSIQTKIGSNRETEVQFTEATNLGKEHILRVSENQTITVGGDRTEIISGGLRQTVVGEVSHTFVGKKNEAVGQDSASTVLGKIYLTSDKGIQVETKQNIDISLDGNLNETVAGSQNTNVTGNITISSQANVSVSGDFIDLNP